MILFQAFSNPKRICLTSSVSSGLYTVSSSSGAAASSNRNEYPLVFLKSTAGFSLLELSTLIFFSWLSMLSVNIFVVSFWLPNLLPSRLHVTASSLRDRLNASISLLYVIVLTSLLSGVLLCSRVIVATSFPLLYEALNGLDLLLSLPLFREVSSVTSVFIRLPLNSPVNPKLGTTFCSRPGTASALPSAFLSLLSAFLPLAVGDCESSDASLSKMFFFFWEDLVRYSSCLLVPL
mmetsp:Transcript_32503/g.37065  ORF Transcript_32503/g.37065 Transcript_32503/m.37065 type:complete len:235 (+) Transcript_32503:748-1452(+)